jgi:hypothetical protein
VPDSFDIYTQVLPAISLSDLTLKADNTTAVFDGIMNSVHNHLGSEFETGRITGAEYTKAYIALTSASLQSAVSFLLQKDAALWQAILVRQQAINAVAQEALIIEQTQVQRAQTMNTRLDGVTTVVGAIGKQKDLYDQQITSYQRDSETKAAKMFSDAWITQKTLDEGLTAPDNFTNATVDIVMEKIRENNGLVE